MQLFDASPSKSMVARKILEGEFVVRDGNYERALREYDLNLSVTQLRRALGSLIFNGYVRRYRCEPKLRAAYAANVAGERGVVVSMETTLSLIDQDVRRDPYLPNREVWRYEPTSALQRLSGLRSAARSAMFAR